jgi:flagellar assembly protein FliH
MAGAVKYLFDRDFDDLEILKEIVEQEKAEEKAAEDSAEGAEPEEPPAPTFSEEDLAKARRESYERGKKEGAADVLAGIEQKIATSLDKIAAGMDGLMAAQAASSESTQRDAAALSVAVVRKLFPKLNAEHGSAEVVEMLKDVLANLIREPRVTILVNPEAGEGVQTRIKEFLERRGFRGELAVRGDAAMSPGDCRIEWMGGEAMRDSGALLAEIEAAAERQTGVTMPRPEDTQG